MARSGANLSERMQLFRPRRPKEAIPGVGTEPDNAGKASFQVAKFHRSQQRGEVSAERANSAAIFNARVECCDQEDRGAGERPGNRLRLVGQAACLEFTVSRALNLVSHRVTLLAAE
jgi:hypothetical protein